MILLFICLAIIKFLDKNPKSQFSNLTKEYCGVKYLNNGIRDPRAFVDEKKIEALQKEIESFAKTIQTTSQNNITQETIDGYSVAYLSANEINNIVSSKNFELQDIMMTDLYGVIVNGEHIIYNGAR